MRFFDRLFKTSFAVVPADGIATRVEISAIAGE